MNQSRIDDAKQRYDRCLTALKYAQAQRELPMSSKDYWDNSIARWKDKLNTIARENPMIKKGMIK